MRNYVRDYENWCLKLIDAPSLSVFRILFGLFLIIDAIFFWQGLENYFSAPRISLRFPIFLGWPHLTTQENGWVLGFLTVAGVLVAVGWKTRWASALASLALIHFLVFDIGFYLNHLVLTLLIAWMFTLVPTDRYFAWEKSVSSAGDQKVPRYQFYAVMGVFLMSYFFSSIEKLRPEWLSGDILAVNMGLNQSWSPLARWLYESPPYLEWGAWGSLLVEFLAPFGLFWKKSRLACVILLVVFHFFNLLTMHIGLFSYLMFFAMVLYFEPAWPSKALFRFRAFKKLPRES